ncbi:MAG: ferritin-like domain-containing protein [Gemmatimonadaceae bacterium]
MNRNDVISVLNDLIETSEDGLKVFRTCADGVTNSEAKGFFTNRVRLIEQGEAELKAAVRALGGDPDNRGTVRGALHRAAINLTSAITGKDEGAVLDQCARAEDAAVENYEEALRKDLPPEVRAIVERQYRGVLENRDRVRLLKDRGAAARPGVAREASREAGREAPPPV